MPFRYGIATMTEGPVVFVRLRVADGGREVFGIASDLLPPKWFTKMPDKPIAEEIDELLGVILHACKAAVGLRGKDAFEVWRQLYDAQAAWGRQEKLPPLLWNFGVSLVERALIEAVARSRGSTFSRLLREGALGLRLDSIHPELRGRSAGENHCRVGRALSRRLCLQPRRQRAIQVDRTIPRVLGPSLAPRSASRGLCPASVRRATVAPGRRAES